MLFEDFTEPHRSSLMRLHNDFLDVLVLAHIQHVGWSAQHLSSGDYNT